MSNVVEILRPIRTDELVALSESDPELSLLDHGEGWMLVSWRKDDEEATFELAHGRITVTSPSDRAWEKANELAARLGAQVASEAEQSPALGASSKSLGGADTLWLGWPVLVIVLAALLAWRW